MSSFFFLLRAGEFTRQNTHKYRPAAVQEVTQDFNQLKPELWVHNKNDVPGLEAFPVVDKIMPLLRNLVIKALITHNKCDNK